MREQGRECEDCERDCTRRAKFSTCCATYERAFSVLLRAGLRPVQYPPKTHDSAATVAAASALLGLLPPRPQQHISMNGGGGGGGTGGAVAIACSGRCLQGVEDALERQDGEGLLDLHPQLLRNRGPGGCGHRRHSRKAHIIAPTTGALPTVPPAPRNRLRRLVRQGQQGSLAPAPASHATTALAWFAERTLRSTGKQIRECE